MICEHDPTIVATADEGVGQCRDKDCGAWGLLQTYPGQCCECHLALRRLRRSRVICKTCGQQIPVTVAIATVLESKGYVFRLPT